MAESKLPDDRYTHVFETKHLKDDLKGRSVRGGAVTAAGQILKALLQIVGLAILARLLSPEDFGLIAMVVSITGFLMVFKDMGLSMATLQQPKINHRQISTLFWVNVAIGAGLNILAIIIAPLVAWFYDEPRLIGVTVVLGTMFLFSGLSIQHQALLRRQMKFTHLAVIEVAAMGLGTVVAVLVALKGFGYWALVSRFIGYAAGITIGVWLACRWIPGSPVRNAGARAMLYFGGNLTGARIMDYFSRNLDKILLGKVWGKTLLGHYNNAYRIMILPIQQLRAPLSAVAIPTLSRLQNEPERYRRYYLTAILLIASLTMPAMVWAMIMSDQLVFLVLGPGWDKAAEIFFILAITGLVQPIGGTCGWLFVSQGRGKDNLQTSLITGSATIAAMAAGLPWGAVGVATAYAIESLCFRTPFTFWFVGRKGPVRMKDFYRALVLPVSVAGLVALVLVAYRNGIGYSNPFVGLLVAFFLMGFTCVLIFSLTKSGREVLVNVKELTLIVLQKNS